MTMELEQKESTSLLEKVISDTSLSPKILREKIIQAENRMKELPGAMIGDCCPLKHTFVEGAYVREIFMPKGLFLTSKIHKMEHPFFIMQGEVSVFNSEDGKGSRKLKAPYHGITPAGTKRILYIHEDTVWITVHVTKEIDLEKVEAEIILPSYELIEATPEQHLIEEV